jgi:hypothetical protein
MLNISYGVERGDKMPWYITLRINLAPFHDTCHNCLKQRMKIKKQKNAGKIILKKTLCMPQQILYGSKLQLQKWLANMEIQKHIHYFSQWV